MLFCRYRGLSAVGTADDDLDADVLEVIPSVLELVNSVRYILDAR